jgi:host factor-I protein
MENKPAQNIQDSFLNTARKEKLNITIYLLSGVKLTGRIRSFDKYSVVLETNNQEQLIFKHAISTVVMGRVPHDLWAHGEGKPTAVAVPSRAPTRLPGLKAKAHSSCAAQTPHVRVRTRGAPRSRQRCRDATGGTRENVRLVGSMCGCAPQHGKAP